MSTVINVLVAWDWSQFCLVPGVSFTEQPLALSVATVSLRIPSLHQAVLSFPLVGQEINWTTEKHPSEPYAPACLVRTVLFRSVKGLVKHRCKAVVYARPVISVYCTRTANQLLLLSSWGLMWLCTRSGKPFSGKGLTCNSVDQALSVSTTGIRRLPTFQILSAHDPQYPFNTRASDLDYAFLKWSAEGFLFSSFLSFLSCSSSVSSSSFSSFFFSVVFILRFWAMLSLPQPQPTSEYWPGP